jgi:hypothetical protein
LAPGGQVGDCFAERTKLDAAVVGGVAQCGGELVAVEVVAGDELVEVGVVAVAGVEVAEGDGGGKFLGDDGGDGVGRLNLALIATPEDQTFQPTPVHLNQDH